MADLDQLIKNIVYIRKKNGLNQEAFGELLGLNRLVIGSYEQRNANPSITTLMEIAERFEIDIYKLLYVDLQALDIDPMDDKQIYKSRKEYQYIDVNMEFVRLTKKLIDAYEKIEELKK